MDLEIKNRRDIEKELDVGSTTSILYILLTVEPFVGWLGTRVTLAGEHYPLETMIGWGALLFWGWEDAQT